MKVKSPYNPTPEDLLAVPSVDINFVESYVFDYNRFLSPEKNGYVRMNIFYSNLTSLAKIKLIVAQFKKMTRTIP